MSALLPLALGVVGATGRYRRGLLFPDVDRRPNFAAIQRAAALSDDIPFTDVWERLSSVWPLCTRALLLAVHDGSDCYNTRVWMLWQLPDGRGAITWVSCDGWDIFDDVDLSDNWREATESTPFWQWSSSEHNPWESVDRHRERWPFWLRRMVIMSGDCETISDAAAAAALDS